MKGKRLFRSLLGLLVVVAVIVAMLVMFMDRMARSAIEQGGTYALGVPTTLNDLDIGFLSGSVDMSGLKVSNPVGFDTPHFFWLGDGRVTVSVGSLMQDKVVVPELILSGINVNLEQKGGQSNYKVILNHLKKVESKEEPSQLPEPTPGPPPKQDQPGKRFVIEKLALRDIDVKIDFMPIGGKATRVPIKIDRIELENVGSEDNQGVKIGQLTAIVIKGVLTAIQQKATDLPAGLAADLGESLDELRGVAVHMVDDLAKEVNAVTQQLGEVGKDVGRAVGEELQDMSKKIEQGWGNLLDKASQKKDERSP